MLWTDEILNLLQPDQCLESVFIGCFASDQIPTDRPYPNVLITNCSPSNEMGDHWVAIFEPNESQSYLFDSYGRTDTEISDTFAQFLKNARYKNLTHNSSSFQSPFSTTCGYFACFFVIGVCHGLKPEELFSFFRKDNVNFNELLVTSFVKDYLNIIKNESET